MLPMRLWLAVQRIRHWSLTIAAAVSLVVGALLGLSSLAIAQPAAPGPDPSFFTATGYRIATPAILNYYQRRGGVRTFGYPVSNEFALLGRRVQLFQRQMLEITPDGTVRPANILDPGVLPISRIDGLTLPPVDQELVDAAPLPDSADYATQALAFINLFVPDEWNGLPVNFQATLLNTVTCADAFGTDPCDPSLLPSFALELWGLPTSLPTTDPFNSNFVYQRFERGIMHYSRASGATQGLLVGDWLKRIMIGVDLSPDLSGEVRQSRLFAQYAPSRPLAIDRPNDLPDSSLSQAFRADTLNVAGQMQQEPTLATSVALTATAAALSATPTPALQAILTQTALVATATAQASGGGGGGFPTRMDLAATATAAALLSQQPTATPALASTSTVPVVNVGCMGDEQMWFVPRKPSTGVHVAISVTSQRHHDVRAMALSGPMDPGPVTERTGPLGFVWTWTVVPTVQDFHDWTFFADGLRPCITSGFNAYAPLGATATPTSTRLPTNTAIPTNTPGATATSTPPPRPGTTGLSPNAGGCNQLVRLLGSGFGVSQSQFGGILSFAGPGGTRSPTILAWTDREIDFTVPTGLQVGGSYQVFVSLSTAGTSDSLTYSVTGPPTPTPAPAGTPTPTPLLCS